MLKKNWTVKTTEKAVARLKDLPADQPDGLDASVCEALVAGTIQPADLGLLQDLRSQTATERQEAVAAEDQQECRETADVDEIQMTADPLSPGGENDGFETSTTESHIFEGGSETQPAGTESGNDTVTVEDAGHAAAEEGNDTIAGDGEEVPSPTEPVNTASKTEKTAVNGGGLFGPEGLPDSSRPESIKENLVSQNPDSNVRPFPAARESEGPIADPQLALNLAPPSHPAADPQCESNTFPLVLVDLRNPQAARSLAPEDWTEIKRGVRNLRLGLRRCAHLVRITGEHYYDDPLLERLMHDPPARPDSVYET